MPDSKSWTKEWLKAQDKLVQSWAEMAQDDAPNKTTNAADLWTNGFDAWRKQHSPPSGDAGKVIDKCMDIGRGYFSMAEQIGKQISSGGKPQDVITRILEQLQSALHQNKDPWSQGQQQPGHDFMSQWASPSASWQKLSKEMMPAQFSHSDSSTHGIGEDFDHLGKLLSAPGIGFSRESQEKQQQGIKLALEYFQSKHKFDQALLRVSITSLQSFRQKFTAGEDSETRSESSLRAMYDLWVDTSEIHYAEFAISAEYKSLYGDMVNKLMALKKHSNDIVDEFLQSMSLPSRREVDNLEHRVHQLRRDNQDLRSELKQIRALLKARAPTKTETGKKQPVIKAVAKSTVKARKPEKQ